MKFNGKKLQKLIYQKAIDCDKTPAYIKKKLRTKLKNKLLKSVTPQALSGWIHERGYNPSLKNLEQMRLFFGLKSIDELFKSGGRK